MKPYLTLFFLLLSYPHLSGMDRTGKDKYHRSALSCELCRQMINRKNMMLHLTHEHSVIGFDRDGNNKIIPITTNLSKYRLI